MLHILIRHQYRCPGSR